jgi:hypothetical protein
LAVNNYKIPRLNTRGPKSKTMQIATTTLSLLAAISLSVIPVHLNADSPIPWSQIGAKAGPDYQGDGLGVSPTAQGARLRCVFQRLEGEATSEGLWLTSTAVPPGGKVRDRFRVVAEAVGRHELGTPWKASLPALPSSGNVAIDAQTVRFTRPGLAEEYSVSLDGVRQDFVVLGCPAGAGELAVRLAVSGAQVEPTVSGAGLVLDKSGRKIAYSRLRVTDATGRELTARMEVATANSEFRIENSELAVAVDDADAVYPVRIDPTFSDANWNSMGTIPGTDSLVQALAVDGAGNVYIGGRFTAVGDTLVNSIAKWNGSSWSTLGSGIFGNVYALAVSGNDVYAGGQFTNAGGIVATNIAKWNGSSWSALGSGLSGPASYPYYGSSVFALAVLGSNVYAGGVFTTAGGSAVTNIAKWDGSSWSALGLGIPGSNVFLFGSPAVNALAVSGNNLYAGGFFNTAGGIPAANIAKWNGSSWSALGSGMDTYGYVYALAASGSNVYAGGTFTTAGGIAASGIAKWNGSSWSALGLGISGGELRSLAVSGTNVYAGGYFTTAGGIPANHIAKWDGNSWSAMGTGVSRQLGQYTPGVFGLALLGSNLYAGGAFSAAGESTASGIAKWAGSSWSALGSGMNGYVNALAVSGSDLYMGGEFTKVFSATGYITANYIAKWNGSSWSALGSGMNGAVRCLAVLGSNVYAGGGFTNAGGTAANFIAKWNGSSWSPMGSGMNSDVAALAIIGSDLYAGGFFTRAGGSTVNYIAKWNGSSWSHVGTGISGSGLFALAVSGSDLYAGGAFTTAGGIPAANIAKWNGSSWSALGSGVDNTVYALAASGSGDVYAGGSFFYAGGIETGYIAKWDGSSWSPLDSGIPGDFYYSGGSVYALAVSGSDVYMGGAYVMNGDGPGTNIAKWDGSKWSPLGSGVNGSVYTLALAGSDLYAGGGFSTAGGKVSQFIARAYLLPLPTLSVSPSSIPLHGITISWPSADTDGFELQQAATPNAPASWVSTIASITDDGTTKSVTLPATNRSQFFRLRRP